MTKLNETKIQDILLMYTFFKRVKRENRGKVLSDTIGSLAKAFKMSVPTIQKVIEGKTVKTERKSKEIVDNFDRQTIRFVIHSFYAENMLPSAKMIQKRLKEKNIKICINRLYKYRFVRRQ